MSGSDADLPQPMLRGELVYLAGVEPDDFIEHGRWISDFEIGHNLGAKAPISRDASERYAREHLPKIGTSLFSFSIRLLADGRRIGGVSLERIDRENGSAGVGIFIGERSLLGRGYGTDALRCLLDFGFGELRLERIELEVFDYNRRAMRSYEKAGLATDAVLRHARYHHGAYHDVRVMAILRDEWLAQERRRAWDPVG